MRAVFLTHYFPPEHGAAQARIAALTRGLRAAGTEVSVHTGVPHYPDGAVKPPFRNRPWQRDPAGPVPVLRSAVLPVANRGFARRLADHTAFAASALATARLSGPADVVVVESPPLFTAAAGVLYARAKRAALVVNVADRWPATAVELGALTDRRAIAAAEALERWCYRHADAVTTPTQGIADALAALPDAGPEKVRRVLPAVDLDRFDAAPPAAASAADGPLRVVYAGTVGLAQGIATLVEAARLAGPATVEVTIAGDGAEADEVRALAAGVPNVVWMGPRPPEEVPGLYAAADAGAVLLTAEPILEGAFPTKLLEVMAAGRAVVLAARGEAAAEVREAAAGVAVAPEDPAALAAAFAELHADRARVRSLGAAGRARVEARYARARSVEHWQALLDEVVTASRRSRPAAAARRRRG